MRDKQIATCLSRLPCVTVGGLISTRRKHSLVNLSEILETSQVPHRYFLSPKACAGILRRAEKRGKELPEMLRRALQAVAEASNGPGKPAAKTLS